MFNLRSWLPLLNLKPHPPSIKNLNKPNHKPTDVIGS